MQIYTNMPLYAPAFVQLPYFLFKIGADVSIYKKTCILSSL